MKAKIIIFILNGLSLLSLSSVRKLGALFGACCWVLPTRMTKIIRTNLKLCFPELSDSERERLGKRSLQETFKTIMEAGPIWLWPHQKVLQSIQRVEGLDVLQSAYSEKKGVLLIAPHLGNWEPVGLYLADYDCGPVTIMYQAPKSPELDKLIFQARSRNGIRLAPTNSKGVATVLSALRRGEIVGILPDQVPPRSGGDYAHFFGINALTMSLISRLINKTGAKAVLAHSKRVDTPEEGPGFDLVFKEANTKVYARPIKESLQGLNDTIESAVRDVPEQYQWEYKRFKRQPEGDAELY